MMKLNAKEELLTWLADARTRLSNQINIETRFPPEGSERNQAMVGLVSTDLVCSITLYGGGYINVTEEVFGNVDYSLHDLVTNKGECKDTVIHNREDLRLALDSALENFLSRFSTMQLNS